MENLQPVRTAEGMALMLVTPLYPPTPKSEDSRPRVESLARIASFRPLHREKGEYPVMASFIGTPARYTSWVSEL